MKPYNNYPLLMTLLFLTFFSCETEEQGMEQKIDLNQAAVNLASLFDSTLDEGKNMQHVFISEQTDESMTVTMDIANVTRASERFISENYFHTDA